MDLNKEAIVVINIINESNLSILNRIPIVFLWDGEGNLTDSIMRHENMKKYLESNNVFKDINLYSNVSLNYCTAFSKTEYSTDKLYIQDIFKISDFENYKNLILNILTDIYYKKIKGADEIGNSIPTDEEKIRFIINKLKEKYDNKLNIETVINYIRQQLKEKYSLNDNNSQFLINIIKDSIDNG